jgi:hypothetical protein
VSGVRLPQGARAQDAPLGQRKNAGRPGASSWARGSGIHKVFHPHPGKALEGVGEKLNSIQNPDNQPYVTHVSGFLVYYVSGTSDTFRATNWSCFLAFNLQEQAISNRALEKAR